ncbi:hypothetical protein CFO_g4398 [Ceratocystis platani]|uniref:Uncharacterized protein n=1 Tax=Ceratocystis fimbriata f. sp. platani TaxID=88771 RepID=A0A0F8BLJ5_CERFI|nr:hypothetical protein CFO_g4398 [Ceratocystis platani]
MDGLNQLRQMRVAELLEDFRVLQYHIAHAPQDPTEMVDYYTEGWIALQPGVARRSRKRQSCSIPAALRVHLDAFSRRHVGQKIHLRQAAAMRWIEYRARILEGDATLAATQHALAMLDQQLRADLDALTDEAIYMQLNSHDTSLNRWTGEDPSLRRVKAWIESRSRV